MDIREQKKLAEQRTSEFLDKYSNLIVFIFGLLMFAGLYLHYNGYEKEIAGLIGLIVLAFVFAFIYWFFKLMMLPIRGPWD